MSQRLRMMIRKDGKAKGVMIRKTKSTKDPKILQTLFNMAYQENQKRKRYAESKSKVA